MILPSICWKSTIFCLLLAANVNESSGVTRTAARPRTCGRTLRRVEFGKKYILRSPKRLSERCRWRLQADMGLVVKVTFLEFQMKSDEGNIALVDIPSRSRFQWNSLNVLLRGSDISVGQYFQYPGNVGGIIYEPKSKNTLVTIQYEAVLPEGKCGFTDFANGRVKQIKSPGFPKISYAGTVDCTWTLRARGTRRVNLVLTDIQLRDGDVLQIYDGTKLVYNHNLLGRSRNLISSSRRGFTVRFVAAAIQSGSGFAAGYRYVQLFNLPKTTIAAPAPATATTRATVSTVSAPMLPQRRQLQQRRASGNECYSFSDNGAGYRGSVSYTKSGLLCQKWSSQYPHEHSRTPDRYIESGLDFNYCRNPDGESGPWCYTSDPEKPWELCDIPQCEECYDPNNAGSSYRGPVTETVTGMGCQKWSSQTPHQHTRTKENYPNFGLESNYCRNPDGESAPWCYTLGTKRWEFCPIPICSVNCYDASDSGATYRGKVSETEAGIPCQKWSIQEPHAHTRTPEKHPRAGLLSNYCRNPDGSERPWCYTTDLKIRWQYCDISQCTESSPPSPPASPDDANNQCYNESDSGASYRGKVRQTTSGFACQSWSSQTPHRHSRTVENYPNSGLEANYCRNPDNENSPWCYTNETSRRWEYCPVQVCPGSESAEPTESTTPAITTTTPAPITEECFSKDDSGASYRGKLTQTLSGLNCQSWSSQTPHKHSRTPEEYPDSGLESNYCRNPDGEEKPWCYTMSSKRWEYCNVQACPDVIVEPVSQQSPIEIACYGVLKVTSGPVEITNTGENTKCATNEKCVSIVAVGTMDNQEFRVSYGGCMSANQCNQASCPYLLSFLPNDLQGITFAMCDKECCGYSRCNKKATVLRPDPLNTSPSTGMSLTPSERMMIMKYNLGFFKSCSLSDYLRQSSLITTFALQEIFNGESCSDTDIEFDQGHKKLDQKCEVHSTATNELSLSARDYQDVSFIQKYIGSLTLLPWTISFGCGDKTMRNVREVFQPLSNLCGAGSTSYVKDIQISAWMLTRHLSSRDKVGFCKDMKLYQNILLDLVLSDKCSWKSNSADKVREAGLRIVGDIARNSIASICKEMAPHITQEVTSPPHPSPSSRPKKCYSFSDKGAGYRGTMSITKSGRKCQNWNSLYSLQYSRESGLEKNHCRNPDGESAPWCFTTDPNMPWELCDVPKCKECYDKSVSGSSYRGSETHSISGFVCQLWSSQAPHEHTRTKVIYPGFGLDVNYCRNPDGEQAPWCYTLSNKRWEYCNVEACPADCYDSSDRGATYRGPISTTEAGLKCQDWSSQAPHAHPRTPDKHPSSGLLSNYCRNPDGSHRPWCYTTDPKIRWQYCNIKQCEESKSDISSTEPQPIRNTRECYSFSDNGAGYRGELQVTKGGLRCQNWNSQYPHEHTRSPSRYPHNGLEQNFCRNPDGESRPWCYTTDPSKRWDYCDIPECAECYDKSDAGASYRGSVRQTLSGFECQDWSSQKPHPHTRTPRNYPNTGLVSNYCRNPDEEHAPWCYTVTLKRWGYCAVAACPADCYDASDSGATYRGSVSESETGLKCQDWSAQTPHEHSKTPAQYLRSGLKKNYCRNPDGMERPWCYTTDPEIRWQYCNISKCGESKESPSVLWLKEAEPLHKPEDCYISADKGAGYRGKVAVTKSGLRCQNWNSQSPHRHTRTPEKDAESGLEKNYCRNPDGTAGPWCYTTDPGKRWELCHIPECLECYNKNNSGITYRGKVAQTLSGFQCQSWSAQAPNKHTKTPANYPNSGLEGNQCRNPDQSSGQDEPWCYTLGQADWEYCPIQACPVDCYDAMNSGATYRGSVSTTESGRECQDWSTQTPHNHDHIASNSTGLEMNYCRNPSGMKKPWCYTTDPNMRWEYCSVPTCHDVTAAKEKKPLLQPSDISCYHTMRVRSGSVDIINTGRDKFCKSKEQCISLFTNGTMDGQIYDVSYGGCITANQCSDITCRDLVALLPEDLQTMTLLKCNKQCCGYSRCNKLATDLGPDATKLMEPLVKPMSVFERIAMMKYDLGFFKACSLRDYLQQTSIQAAVALQEVFSGKNCSKTDEVFELSLQEVDKRCQTSILDTNGLSLSKSDYQDITFVQKYVGNLALLPWAVSFGCGGKDLSNVKDVFKLLTNLCGATSIQYVQDIQTSAWMLMSQLIARDHDRFCMDLKPYQDMLIEFVSGEKCHWKGTNKDLDAVRPSGLRIIADMARNPVVDICKDVGNRKLPEMEPPVLNI